MMLPKCKLEVFARLFQKAAGFGAEPHQILRSRRKARKKSEAIFSGFYHPGKKIETERLPYYRAAAFLHLKTNILFIPP